MIERLCLFCKNFYFDPGQPGYSDETPGSDMSIGCNVGYWDEDDIFDEADYRQCQLKAQTCQDFNQVELPTEERRAENETRLQGVTK